MRSFTATVVAVTDWAESPVGREWPVYRFRQVVLPEWWFRQVNRQIHIRLPRESRFEGSGAS